MRSVVVTAALGAGLMLAGCNRNAPPREGAMAAPDRTQDNSRARQDPRRGINGATADRENRAGQAVNGDARGTPATAPPPVTPGDRDRAGQNRPGRSR